jgi:hypothetical protein
MLSRWLICCFVAGTLLSEAEGFSFSPRPVRGSTSIVGSKSSSTALYAEAKKKKKKKATSAADEIVMKQQEVAPPKARDPPPTPEKKEDEEEAPKKKEKVFIYNEDGVYLGPQVETPDTLDFDLTGGRPQVIIETSEDLAQKATIFQEIDSGKRSYPKWFGDYGVLEEEMLAEYDTDDPEAIDASTLGTYDFSDYEAKFDYEYDPETEQDPNILTNTKGFIQENEKDEEGVEVGYDPLFGPSNPVDIRTKTGAAESYMIDQETRNDDMLTPEFRPGDPEIEFNEEVIQFRKSLDIIESYVDEFLPADMVVPRHVAKWHGYVEPTRFPKKNYTNNRFTKEGDLTNFDALSPFRARQRAVELARAKNAEWLPDGFSQAYHKQQRQSYEDVGTLVGTLREGEIDDDVVELIQPALHVLGSSAKLLSIEQGTVFRFHYHGLMKNKYGMACWAETLIRDCGVEVSGVVFETGFRRRDPAYDGGDPYYGYS